MWRPLCGCSYATRYRAWSPVLGALGDASYHEHPGKSLPSVPSEHALQLHMWHTRRMGRDVLICDIDAIWIRDPLPKLLATRAGIVSSPGLSPGDAIKKYGVAFCMGFIFIRGSDLKVRDAMFALTKPMREDQGDFNQNMMREGLEYDTIKVGFTNETSYGRLHARGKSYDGLRVAMLPRSRFMRQCSPNTDFTATGNVVIAHCHSHGKQPYLKTKILSEMKLWFVPPPADGISVPQPDTDPPMPEPGTQAWTAWHNRSTQ
ncbi:hypothetical protein T492DRAFT_1072810 [Pavlovales sp. CCMP2436]|nr:hypothetical protein T492DRAFT_1072810 [Pavlovales sp. CCMP2436]|mmetsp:Transcript_16327/g.41612  ORF Transcript_16327/g.41612 Transcript_16327/m.41612 type:complete len:261 (+) Transcript_16327:194-976(+)